MITALRTMICLFCMMTRHKRGMEAEICIMITATRTSIIEIQTMITVVLIMISMTLHDENHDMYDYRYLSVISEKNGPNWHDDGHVINDENHDMNNESQNSNNENQLLYYGNHDEHALFVSIRRQIGCMKNVTFIMITGIERWYPRYGWW